MTTLNEIKARGNVIKLANGDTMTVRYDFDGMAEIETTYGSVAGLMDELKNAERGPLYTIVAHVLWAGSDHSQTLTDFRRSLDTRHIQAYIETLTSSLVEAMGSSDEDGTPGEPQAA